MFNLVQRQHYCLTLKNEVIVGIIVTGRMDRRCNSKSKICSNIFITNKSVWSLPLRTQFQAFVSCNLIKFGIFIASKTYTKSTFVYFMYCNEIWCTYTAPNLNKNAHFYTGVNWSLKNRKKEDRRRRQKRRMRMRLKKRCIALNYILIIGSVNVDDCQFLTNTQDILYCILVLC